MMLSQGDIVSHFACTLSEAHGFEACFKLLNDSVQSLGFDGVLYMSIPVGLVQHKEKTPITIFQASNAYAPTFLDHYAQANFADNDFTLKEIAAGKKDLIDWWGTARKNVLNESEIHVITIAREEYKMRNGLSVPTLCTSYEIAGGSVVSYANDTTYATLINDHSR